MFMIDQPCVSCERDGTNYALAIRLGEYQAAFTAEELFQRIAKQGRGKFEINPGRITDHVERVVRLCGRMADEIGGVDKELLLSAAWLHDIAKSLNDEEKRKKHHKPKNVRKAVSKAFKAECKSAWIDRDAFEKQLRDDRNFSRLAQIIKAHKSDFYPPEDLRMESAILRMADKLDKYVKDPEKAAESCKKSLEKIQDYFDSRDTAQEFARLNAAYQNELSRIT